MQAEITPPGKSNTALAACIHCTPSSLTAAFHCSWDKTLLFAKHSPLCNWSHVRFSSKTRESPEQLKQDNVLMHKGIFLETMSTWQEVETRRQDRAWDQQVDRFTVNSNVGVERSGLSRWVLRRSLRCTGLSTYNTVGSQARDWDRGKKNQVPAIYKMRRPGGTS